MSETWKDMFWLDIIFQMGLKYKDMRDVLDERHNICSGLRQLKLLLQAQGLARRNYSIMRQDLISFGNWMATTKWNHGIVKYYYF